MPRAANATFEFRHNNDRQIQARPLARRFIPGSQCRITDSSPSRAPADSQATPVRIPDNRELATTAADPTAHTQTHDRAIALARVDQGG
jgi:hypothetical protein